MEEYELKPKIPEYSNWIKGPIENEGGEFLRVFKEFYDKSDFEKRKEFIYDSVRKSYAETSPQDLSESIWSNLKNTDSQDIKTGDLKKVESLIGDTRDWELIVNSFKINKNMKAPIIAILPNGEYHLISGNTRLCVAKALGIKPQVIFIKFP